MPHTRSKDETNSAGQAAGVWPGTCRMPAEWETHEATWLAWPHYRKDWPGKFAPIPWVYSEIIRYLAKHEGIELIVKDAVAENEAKEILERANALSSSIRFHRWPTDRVWMRDSGCLFVAHDGGSTPDGQRLGTRHSAGGTSRAAIAARASMAQSSLYAVKWRFNAWAKYSNWRLDETIGARMAKAVRARQLLPVFGNERIVLEGGAIDVNGQGSLITTEECLLSSEQQRNPGMGREDYEKIFRDYLGSRAVIWLGGGIVGDDTHGHVDDLCRFIAPHTVVTMVERNRHDPNHDTLEDNLRRLRAARDQDGQPLQIVEVPMPAAIIFEKRRLPASYANFYIANGLVLVPVFNDPNDRIALDILSALLPGRDVVGIYAGDLIWGLGAIHCMTQQQPSIGRKL